jgi:hypothetical protein
MAESKVEPERGRPEIKWTGEVISKIAFVKQEKSPGLDLKSTLGCGHAY